MMASIWSAFKWFWLMCSIGIFLLTLSIYDGKPATQDAEFVLLYGMLVLSFPVCQLVAVIFWLIALLVEATLQKFSIPMNYLTLVIEWVVFFVTGYVQWFVFLPWLWSKWKARRGSSSTRPS